MANEEKKNKQIGMVVSIGLHGLLLLLFVLLLAYREPDPPLPDYGIELNFGLQAAGSGEIQPETPANNNTTEEEAAPDPAQPETTPEEVAEEPVETTQPTEEAITEPDPQPVEEEVVTQPDPTPVQATEEEKPATTPEETKPVDEPEEEQPTPSESTTNEDTKTGADGDAGDADTAPASNQGNQPDATGDQGDPQGSLDSRALMGNPGGGGGAQLDMEGWKWDNAPKVSDNSSDRGFIVFEITVDEFGVVENIRRIDGTVSTAVENKYRDAVYKLSFSRTSGTAAPPMSKGRITFIIKDQ